MSMKVMTRVWAQSKQKGSALLLLLAIADNANDDNKCWPGVFLLHEKTRMSERQTQRLVQYLSTTDELAVEWNAGRGSSNMYHVLVGLPESQIRYIKDLVDQKNRDRGFEEWAKKISEACREHGKGDKMTPIEPVKGDILTPQNSGKGVIFDGKGDKFRVKGDIAMSPEPINLKNQREEEPEESGAILDTPLQNVIVITADPPATEILQAVKSQLRHEMQRGAYLQYVEPLNLVGWVDGIFRVSIPGIKTRDFVRVNLGRQIDRLITGYAGREVHVEVQVRGT